MIRLTRMQFAAGALATFLSCGAFAQGAPQAVTEKRTDVVQLGSGYRASKLHGASVYNRNKDEIGTFDDLQIDNRQVILPDATKKSIEALPEFKYAPD
jgi:hypothetical protein